MPEPEGERYCQATGEVIDADDIDSGHWMTSAVSSRSHCPVIPAFADDPIEAYPIENMIDRIASGEGIQSPRVIAYTVFALCLAGF